MLCIMPSKIVGGSLKKQVGDMRLAQKQVMNWNRWKMRWENSYKYSWELGGWLQKSVGLGDDGKMATKTGDIQEVDSLN